MEKTIREAATLSLQPPTTKDLARVAGVSRATIDRVLNGRGGVTQKTVERVNAAIAQLGFERNLSAANLAKGRSYRFLFALPKSGDLFLQEVLKRIAEAESIFAAERVMTEVHHIDENDPHGTAGFLSRLTPEQLDGVAIMAPETPQVRDAIQRLQERGVKALPFISNQGLASADWVGIDNRAAGRTAALLLGRFIHPRRGKILVVAESMQSRDSLDRRQGFDSILNARFPGLTALPSLETYGMPERAHRIIATGLARNPDVCGAYILSSEARIPLARLAEAQLAQPVVAIAHERTPFTEAALRDETLDALITQDPGHLVRSAIRKLRALADNRSTLESQERIRIEVLLPTNL
ncbi:MAG: LacI family DNA-binding transcriptional regulator [Pseudomonadota bacterium]